MAFLLAGLRNLLLGKDKPTVAIDLGTAYSGFAFSFNKEQGKDSIVINRSWVNELGHQTNKTPTCLLLKPDLSFDSFGYKAVQRYAHLRDVYTFWNEFLFFENFKMSFTDEEVFDLDSKIEASNGIAVRKTTVFAHCIKFLRHKAVNVIRHETGDESYKVDDIHWVLTVPITWTSRAKQFMREAAYEAGIGSHDNPGQVLIASDAEAAALYCTTSQETAALDESNKQYLLFNVGGSRLGVAAFENQDDGALQTIYKANSEPLGGAMVNCQFKNLWDALLGAQKMHDYRQLFPSDWLKMMQDFEANMRTSPHQGTKIHLPGSFVSWVNDFRSPSLKRFGEGEVQIIRDEYLCLSSRVMRRLFKPLVEAIKGYLSDTVLNKPRLSKIKTMILVGGLADFPFLQEEIKNMISGRSCVVIPNEAIVAVVRGAVIFGKRAAAAKKRVVGASYGADCSRRFIQGVHPEENKFMAAGEEKCKDLFNCFVKKDAIVKGKQRVTITYRPRDANETQIMYSFYTADNPDVLLVTEPGVTHIGRVVVESPDTLKGLDRDIEVSLCFSGTDVIATAWDVTSGNMAQTTLDVYSSF